MSADRCRACGAAVPEEAQWCSLCFADLRPPAPVREPVSVPAAAEPVAAEVAAPVLAPPAAPAELSREEILAGTPLADPPVQKEVRWPCHACGATNSMDLDLCAGCGAAFLSGASSHTKTELPLVGDVQRLSQSQRLVMGVVASIVLIAVFFLIAELIDHL